MSLADEEILVYGPNGQRTGSNGCSVGEYFYRRLVAGGEKIAQIIENDGEGDERMLRYSEMLHGGKVVAGLLRTRGVTSADAVLSVTGNTLDHAPVFWAAQFVGAAIAAADPRYGLDDMLHLVRTFRPQLVFVNEDAEMTVREALVQYEDKKVVLITLDEMYGYIEDNPSEEGFYLGKIEDPDSQIAAAVFTSGSSGKPKCAEFSHTTILRQLDTSYFKLADTDKQQDVCVNISGPYGVWGQTINLQAINATMVCLLVPIELFTSEAFTKSLVKYEVNYITLCPRHLLALLKGPACGKHDLSRVKACLVAGAPVSRAMQELARTKLRINVTPTYATAEAGVVCSPAFGVVDRPASVGKLADNVVAKLVDVKTGETLGPGEQGEMHVKAPYGMLRFRNNAEATEAAFDRDGFLKTGDFGFYDEDGYFYMVDRISDTIKYKHSQIPPVEIEAVLLRHIKVQEVCVVGLSRETDGEQEHATAIVVLRQGEVVSEEELVTLVKKNLPEIKWLHGGVRFVKSLPYSLSGKIKRRLLRDEWNAADRKMHSCVEDVPS